MVKKLIINIVGVLVPLYLVVLVVQVFMSNTIIGYIVTEIPQLEKLNPINYRFGLVSLYNMFTDFGSLFTSSYEFLADIVKTIVKEPMEQWLLGSTELAIDFGTYVETFDLGALLVDFNSFEDVLSLLKGYADYFYNFGMMIMMFIFILGYWIFSPIYAILSGITSVLCYFGSFLICSMKVIINIITGYYNVPVQNLTNYQIPTWLETLESWSHIYLIPVIA